MKKTKAPQNGGKSSLNLGKTCLNSGFPRSSPEFSPEFPGIQGNSRLLSADCKRGRRKGATSKNIKTRQKVTKCFRQFSRRAKSVKNRQKPSRSFSTLFDNFRAAPFFRLLLGGSDFTQFSRLEGQGGQRDPNLLTIP